MRRTLAARTGSPALPDGESWAGAGTGETPELASDRATASSVACATCSIPTRLPVHVHAILTYTLRLTAS